MTTLPEFNKFNVILGGTEDLDRFRNFIYTIPKNSNTYFNWFPESILHPKDIVSSIREYVSYASYSDDRHVIVTHSSYVVRELNNMIMLGDMFVGYEDLMSKYEYDSSHLIARSDISAFEVTYINRELEIREVITDDEGIIAESIDEVINYQNNSSNEIYFANLDSEEDHE